MPSDKHYAHSLKDRPVDEWHLLDAHLKGTAERAEGFAYSFAPGWGTAAGLLHDAGKYQLAFQQRIGVDPDAHTNQSVDHSSVGALIAKRGRMDPLTFVVAGHHGGMPNKEDLKSRLAIKEYLLPRARANGLPSYLETIRSPSPPAFVGSEKRKYALWTRFLFSALVDADFLDTEAFYSGEPTATVGT
jgi:CRISPR-associated endonuclease/helicase Cas3